MYLMYSYDFLCVYVAFVDSCQFVFCCLKEGRPIILVSIGHEANMTNPLCLFFHLPLLHPFAQTCFARFQTCCKNALSSALELVSKCSGISADILEKQYRKACNDTDGSIFETDLDEEFQEEKDIDENDTRNDNPDGEMSCADVIAHIQQEAKFMADLDADDAIPPSDEPLEMECSLPDWENLSAVLSADKLEESDKKGESAGSTSNTGHVGGNYLPSTLREALLLPGNFFNSLFRLIIKLRSAPGGCCTSFIPNARSSRRASGGLNWHQFLP